MKNYKQRFHQNRFKDFVFGISFMASKSAAWRNAQQIIDKPLKIKSNDRS